MPTLSRWLQTWSELGVERSSRLEAEHASLLARYTERHRHYHTLQHLAECFAWWPELRAHTRKPAEVEAAIWFHDAIYDTHRDDNEACSAALARDSARALGVAAGASHRIHALVMATRHDAQPSGIDAEALVDVDLSILSAPPRRFAEYEHQVRAEYDWVPEAQFRTRRAEILRGFLARPHIYSTTLYREQHEPRARSNLRHSLEALGGE